MKSPLAAVFDQPAAAGLRSRLGTASPAAPLTLTEVDPRARALALASVLHASRELPQPPAVAWIACPDLRSQERLSTELGVWGVSSLFLPRQRADLLGQSLPDPDEEAERLGVLDAIHRATPQAPVTVLLEAASFAEQVPLPQSLDEARLFLRAGQGLDPLAFVGQLQEAGYQRVPLVTERGQFALRGGIVDLFAWDQALPLRLEFFDDELESLREFDPDAQTSLRALEETSLLLTAQSGPEPTSPEAPAAASVALSDWLERPGQWLLAVDQPALPAAVHLLETTSPAPDLPAAASGLGLFAAQPDPLGHFEAGDFLLQATRRERIADQLRLWAEDSWTVQLFCLNPGERQRLLELDESLGLNLAALDLRVGALQHGFTVPALKLAVLSAAELFGRYQGRSARRRHARQEELARNTRPVSVRELRVGDFVVHADYGVARYRGLSATPEGEVLILEYADEAKLKVPLPQSHLISSYVGLGKQRPELSKLGAPGWKKIRAKAEEAVLDYAAHLLQLQAQRQTLPGFAHPPDSRWQLEFEASFPYRETPDQLRAIAQVKKDMEAQRPMDRLLCGDVGFGKTEVALRAAFKAVMSGTQAAILCPTTVLAQQHWQNFRQRLSDYPIRVDLLNRFRTPAQQRETLRGLADGSVDIVIGTHRLLSKDVQYQNLGLAVVDEEQRFGVKHKERFKELFQFIDLLTLSATPIPRTLYQGLVGVRDMSTLETAPLHRHSVQTTVSPYDEKLIQAALQRELERGGQVFFLHNRVQSIELIASKIQQLAPGARVLIGHGQMDEHQLEDTMQAFLDGQADILVCTTIIETGIDIPNANTIFIDRADRFGLADLYQLRGRVGRAHHQGYAYLLLPSDLIHTEARKRVNAIRQYSNLGDGLRIAMRDLEIRGAGNLLGLQQSGHIVQVGFELYCQLLRQSIAKLQGKAAARHTQVVLRADFLVFGEANLSLDDELNPTRGRPGASARTRHGRADDPPAAKPNARPSDLAPGQARACLPAHWIQEAIVRLRAYRELAELSSLGELNLLEKSWKDRFGPFPDEVRLLLLASELKLRAARAHIDLIEIQGHKLKLRRNQEFIQPGGKFPRLTGHSPEEILENANNLLKQL